MNRDRRSWMTSVGMVGLWALSASAPVFADAKAPSVAAARGASVTASSEVGRLRGKDHTARAAADGQVGEGYWCTAFDSKPPHWLELKFTAPRRFNAVTLHAYEGTAIRSCRLERWNGKAWLPVTEIASPRRPKGDFSPAWEFGDGPSGVVRCQFPAVTSDRVRLWFDKESSVRLYEVEVLELPAAAADAASAPRPLDRNAALVRIALGRRNGGLGPDWQTVTAGSTYTPQQGLGWVGPGNRADCDRGGGAPFARQFVAGWGGAGRLRFDLPEGSYVAAVFATDFVLPVPPFQVEAPGMPPCRPLATVARGAWDVRRFRVQAGPGGLELTFRGDRAWLVNAVLIAPESNVNALLTEADRLEQQLALGSPEWLGKRTIVPSPAPAKVAASNADRQSGYLLFTSAAVERIYPYTRPTAEQIGRPLTVQAAPGEAAAASLGVVPLRPLFGMRFACSDLTTSDGAPIPAQAIDVRVVRCWPQIDKTPAGRNKVQVIPELLEPQDRRPAVCAPEGATRQYWITVRVPAQAAAGQYRGELRFSAHGVPPATVPVELTVLPFGLQTPPEKTFYMYSIFSDMGGQEILTLMRDMREHGMNSLASDLVGAWRRGPDGKPEFDAELLRRVLRLARQAGFTRPMPWHADGPLKGIKAAQGSTEWNAAVLELLRRVRQVQQEVDGQEILFYPVDEPFGNEERLTLAERALGVARQHGTLRTYCTPAHGDIARLGKLLDVRSYAIGSVPNVAEARADSRQAGSTFWWYTNAARELPDVRRYLSGVWFWSTGADGQGYWVYQSNWRRTRPYQDLEGDLHAHDYAAYPDIDGPVPTLQWECIRMGIDDARYLYTLEAAIAQRRATPQAATAERFLADLRRGMPPCTKLHDGTWILYDCPWKPGQFDRLRADCVRHILELHKAARATASAPTSRD